MQNRLKRLDAPDNQSAESEWQKLKVAVTKTAAKTLSKKGRTARKEWVTPETFALIEEKRNCSRTGNRYWESKQEAQAHLRPDRMDHLNAICQEMIEHERKNRSKELFATVDRMTTQACPAEKVIHNPNGHTLTEDTDMLE